MLRTALLGDKRTEFEQRTEKDCPDSKGCFAMTKCRIGHVRLNTYLGGKMSISIFRTNATVCSRWKRGRSGVLKCADFVGNAIIAPRICAMAMGRLLRARQQPAWPPPPPQPSRRLQSRLRAAAR